MFDAAQDDLEKAVVRLFTDAEAELAALPDTVREGKALRSLVNRREGLCVFVDNPQVPPTNYKAERLLRVPAIGRGLSFGPTAKTVPGSPRSCTRSSARSRRTASTSCASWKHG